MGRAAMVIVCADSLNHSSFSVGCCAGILKMSRVYVSCGVTVVS